MRTGPRERRARLIERLVARDLRVTGALGYEKAEVPAGAVRLSEVDPRTLEPRVQYALRDLMVVHPTRTPDDSPVIGALRGAIDHVLHRRADIVASPGTYDHKHIARIAGVPHCVAYGPGELEQAHQPDEHVRIEDLVNSAKVLALAVLDLATPAA